MTGPETIVNAALAMINILISKRRSQTSFWIRLVRGTLCTHGPRRIILDQERWDDNIFRLRLFGRLIVEHNLRED